MPDDEKTKRKEVDEDISVDVTTCDSIQAFLDSDEEEDRDEVFYLSTLPFEDDDDDDDNFHSGDEEYAKKSSILLKKSKLINPSNNNSSSSKKKKFNEGSSSYSDERPRKALKK